MGYAIYRTYFESCDWWKSANNGSKENVCLYTGSMVPAVFMVGVGFVDSDQPIVAVSLLAIANGFTGFLTTGVFVNPLDIAPPFAGTIVGISNSAGTMPGIVAPYIVALMTKNVSFDIL